MLLICSVITLPVESRGVVEAVREEGEGGCSLMSMVGRTDGSKSRSKRVALWCMQVVVENERGDDRCWLQDQCWGWKGLQSWL